MQMLGKTVLQRVAAAYRADPASWSQSWGTRKNGDHVGEDPDLNTIRNMYTMCADVAIKRFSLEVGGASGMGTAAEQARVMVYDHLGVEHKRKSIWDFNDAKGRTVDQMIAMLEAAANGGGESEEPRRQLKLPLAGVKDFMTTVATAVFAPMSDAVVIQQLALSGIPY